MNKITISNTSTTPSNATLDLVLYTLGGLVLVILPAIILVLF